MSTENDTLGRAPGAALSMVWAMAGMITAGVVLGAIAMVVASDAKRRIAEEPRLTGHQLAAAGYWFGVVAIVQHVIRLGARLSYLS